MKTLPELRTEWEGLKASDCYNHTMASGPVSKLLCYGAGQWHDATFDEFVASKRASEHYAELKASADPHCSQCYGKGYLPVSITPSYLQSCGCVFPYLQSCDCVSK